MMSRAKLCGSCNHKYLFLDLHNIIARAYLIWTCPHGFIISDDGNDDGGENGDDENEQSEKISTCRLRGFALCSDLPALRIQYE